MLTRIPPPGGGGTSDAFQKREKANEDYTIRQRERQKLLELKKKLNEQQAHLKQLEQHMYVAHLPPLPPPPYPPRPRRRADC